MSKRLTVNDLKKMKGATPIACLTAYDYVTAGLLDRAGCDLLLIGDSLGNVVLGHETTLAVTMDDILRHTQAVARGSQRALLVADMPFLSYQTSRRVALENAGELLAKGGAQAVKLEGGRRNRLLIQQLVEIGIPVMGHIGMTPQSVNAVGGYKRYGKEAAEAEWLEEEAKILERAGVFAVVLECVTTEVAAKITRTLKIPTIGIGSGDACDGQVLVINDLLGYGLTPPPSFVKPALNLAALVSETVACYVKGVKGK